MTQLAEFITLVEGRPMRIGLNPRMVRMVVPVHDGSAVTAIFMADDKVPLNVEHPFAYVMALLRDPWEQKP